MKCECGGELVTLEMFCTDPYQVSYLLTWFRDIKKRCVCSRCFREQDVLVDTVKQDKRFK